MALTSSHPLNTHYGEIIIEGRKQDLSIMQVTCLLIQTYIPAKGYQKISRGIGAMECTWFYFKTTYLWKKSSSFYNVKSNQTRVFFLAHDTPLGPFPQIYQILLKYVEVMVCTSMNPKYSLKGNHYEERKKRVGDHARNKPAHPDLHLNLMLSKYLKGHRCYGSTRISPWMGGWM